MTEPMDRCEEERQVALRREARRRIHAKYRASAKGKATAARNRKRWRATERGKVLTQAAAEKVTARATHRRLLLLARYGITPAQYDAMLVLQGGVCVICQNPPKKTRLHVEHDHKTGRVRGLACHRCNRLRIGINTAETARRLLAYLASDFDGRKLIA